MISFLVYGGGGSKTDKQAEKEEKKGGGSGVNCNDLGYTEVYWKFSTNALNHFNCSPNIDQQVGFCDPDLTWPTWHNGPWAAKGNNQWLGIVETVIDNCPGQGSDTYWYGTSVDNGGVFTNNPIDCHVDMNIHASSQWTTVTVTVASRCNHCVEFKHVIWEGTETIAPGQNYVVVTVLLQLPSIDPNETIYGAC